MNRIILKTVKRDRRPSSKSLIRQDILLIETLVLLVFFLIALVILPHGAMAASSDRECCMVCCGQGVDAQQCYKSSCTCGTSDSSSENLQPGQCQCYKDVKCSNVCMESCYTSKHFAAFRLHRSGLSHHIFQ